MPRLPTTTPLRAVMMMLILTQKYAIPFLLFADRSRSLSMQLEVRRTPTFIGWGFHPNGDIRPFLNVPGPMESVDAFLGQVVRRSGVELWPDD